MIIDSDRWVTASEAARLLRCSPQRVLTMTEEGSVDALRPWPRVLLIGRESIASWLAGYRPPRIAVSDARRYICKRNEVSDVQTLDLDEVRDQLRAFIADARPRWESPRCDLWALDMAGKLMRSGSYAVPPA